METLKKATKQSYLSNPVEEEEMHSVEENSSDNNSFLNNKKTRLTNTCNENRDEDEGRRKNKKIEIKNSKLGIGSKMKKNQLYFSGKALRGKWNAVEKDHMCNYFKNFITNKKPPKKKDVEEFKIKEKDLFENINWLRIKTFVYNQYKN